MVSVYSLSFLMMSVY